VTVPKQGEKQDALSLLAFSIIYSLITLAFGWVWSLFI
jgi:hypothetical protein